METTQSNAATTKLRIERVFAAPREKVFRAWTDPQAVKLCGGRRDMSVRARR